MKLRSRTFTRMCPQAALLHALALLAAGCAACGAIAVAEHAAAAEPPVSMVNPHWTGIHCRECHGDAAPSAANLLNDGDSVALCNRCHAFAAAGTEPHPVGIRLTQSMLTRFDKNWPFDAQELTCLTCHNALPQMYDDDRQQRSNPAFLRDAPYEKLSEFCFACHTPDTFKKKNPHVGQITASGSLVEESCLFCHATIPDPATTHGGGGLLFRMDRVALCTSCHTDKKEKHPARADHLVNVSDTMTKELLVQELDRDVELPLFNRTVQCVTCHNPHQAGVLQRTAAGAGAGDDLFLRLPAGKELCVACHYDKKIPRKNSAAQPKAPVRPVGTERVFEHKPVGESSCKACHAVTAERRTMPEPAGMCLQQGCHDTDPFVKEFTHPKTVLGRCTFCHMPHSSPNEHLLAREERMLCFTCHQLVRNEAGDMLSGDHPVFTDYVVTLDLEAGRECSLCHSPGHAEEMVSDDPNVCARCHMFVRSKASLNKHDEYSESSCSECHDPHAAPYEYLLREPPDDSTGA